MGGGVGVDVGVRVAVGEAVGAVVGLALVGGKVMRVGDMVKSDPSKLPNNHQGNSQATMAISRTRRTPV